MTCRQAGLPALLLLLEGCTAILEPDDAVDRCGSVDDCEPSEDARYAVECRFPPGEDFDSDKVEKVCVAAFAPLRCDPSSPDSPIFETYDALRRDTSRFVRCDGTPGVRGCSPGATGCVPGLVLRADGICDVEPLPAVPAYPFSSAADPAQDVLDAYCQWFYCEDRFVCRGGSCVVCDPNAPFGEGGCGRVFSEGGPSCIYPPDLTASCTAPETDPAAPMLGTCN